MTLDNYTNFSYATTGAEEAGNGLQVSIFTDRPYMLAQVRDDVLHASHHVVQTGSIDYCLDHKNELIRVDVVILDLHQVGEELCAALTRLDDHSCDVGNDIIISVQLDALDTVYSCLHQSNPHILISTSRIDRLLALARLYHKADQSRLRELSEDDRLALLRLAEQVGEISRSVEALSGKMDEQDDGVFRFEAKKVGYDAATDAASDALVRKPRAPLPDPRLVRAIIEQRQLRAKFFEDDLFADPAWDILLDLTAARAEHKRVSVTSLCIAAAVPPTTALRWIGTMTEMGLLRRLEDDADRRRAFVGLTDNAADVMARYFAELGRMASTAI